MNIIELYDERASTPSDISEHMPTLRSLASHCEVIVEFGVRSGNSTIALLMGLQESGKRTKELWSYDINLNHGVPKLDMIDGDRPAWVFSVANTAKLHDIPECEMLFIDTLHDYEQVLAELYHAPRVSKYLVFHDTVLFGSRDESVAWGPGIMSAILKLLTWPTCWVVHSHATNNNGLLVLERIQEES